MPTTITILDPSNKMQFSFKCAAFVSLAMAGLLACGTVSASSASESSLDKHIEQAIVALKRNTDADSLAAAALLSVSEHRDQSLLLIARATAAAPDRADLQWLHAQLCRQLSPCDPQPIDRRLQELDPLNGAGWFGALSRASASNDEAAGEEALAAISHSERVDIYWTTLIAPLSRAAAKTKKLSLEESETALIGVLAAEAIPAYQYTSNACKGDRLQRPETLESCRGLAKAFQHGDSYLTEMIGVAIAKRSWPQESPEWKAAAEARRVYEYRSKRFMQLNTRGEKQAEEYVALCEKHHREQDVFVAELIAAGEDPNPPPECAHCLNKNVTGYGGCLT
jgi:hypothetical protein